MFRVASTPPNSTWLSIVRLRSGQRSHLATFPWKVDPGVLAYFGDVSVEQRAAQRLGIDHGEMRFRHQLAQYCGRATGIDEIVHHQPAFAIADVCRRLDDDDFIRLL